jgi:hypothetical protein
MPMRIITEGKDKGWARCENCGALLVPESPKYERHLRECLGQSDEAPGRAERTPRAKISIFISHSHFDRAAATTLQRILEKEGVVTFLDQDQFQAGEVLPNRIRDGIDSCSVFLLVWSASAARSRWVENEWNTAYDRRRKIIPYCLDSTPLPDALQNLIHVTRSDQKVAYANLLTAVLGGDFRPSPTNVFPGPWRVVLDAFGMGTATYDLDLRPNGQITGSGKIDAGSALHQIAGAWGIGHLADMRARVEGSWEYDEGTDVLTLDMTVSSFGQVSNEVIQVKMTGKDKRSIRGRDLTGRPFTLSRRS